MADYLVTTPHSLDELDEALPLASEDAEKMDDIMRQTRAILKNVMLLEHNPDGSHKSVTERLSPNTVTGTHITKHATEDSKRAIGTDHIKDAQVTTAKIADGAVTNVKVAAGVDGAKLSDGTVGTTKLVDASITTAKLGANSVDNTKLKSSTNDDNARSVTGDHIRSAAIVARHIADKSLNPNMLQGLLGRILVGDSTGKIVTALVGGNLSIELDETTNPPTAKFTAGLASEGSLIPFAIIREPAGSSPNPSLANKWNVRPGVGLYTLIDKSDLIDIQDKTIIVKNAGVYLYYTRISAAASSTSASGSFQVARLVNITDPANPLDLVVTSPAIVGIPGSGTNWQSMVAFSIFPLTTANTRLQVQHFTETILPFGNNVFASAYQTNLATVAEHVFIKVG